MRASLAIKSVAAFVLTLVVGYFLMPYFRGKAPATSVEVQSVEHAVRSSDLKTVAERSPAYAPFTPGRPVNINRDFKPLGATFQNDNVRMKTIISNVYTGGITHIATPQFGKKVEWRPTAQEVRLGGDVVSTMAVAGPIEAHIEDIAGLKHIVYPSTYASTDEHLYVRPEGGIEHDIILKKQPDIHPSCGLAYTGNLIVGEGLTVWDDKTQIVENYTTRNGLYFKNRLGNTVFYLRAPIAYDANVTLRNGGLDADKQALAPNQHSASSCEYQISFEGSAMKLAVVTPGAWLLNPERAYPVTIDPNFGPFGLADGNPPIYVGTVGSNTLIPAFNSGNQLALDEQCATSPKNDDAYGHIPMPFDFTFYGVCFPGPNSACGPQVNLFVHIDGWASWDPPSNGFADEVPPSPAERPCADFPQAANSFGAIPNGAYPTDGAMYALWNDLRYSGDPQSGIYYFVDGVAPNRRLIIEWHKMGYFRDSNPNDVISFNLILYECQSIIEVIIGDITQGDSFRGDSTIGIESPGDTKAVVYDTYQPPQAGAPATTPIDGLDVTFATSPLGTVTNTITNNMGCIPLTTCFGSSVTTTVPACVQANGGQSIPPSFGFHWTFGDGGQGFTANVCHTYVLPNQYNLAGTDAPTLTVTDEFGHMATFINNLNVIVCDRPPVSISATPQGGTAPLTVNLLASSTTPYIQRIPPPGNQGLIQTIDSYDLPNTAFVIDQLDPQNLPNQFTPFKTILGGVGTTAVSPNNPASPVDTISATVLFDTPGTYRVQGVFPGKSFTLPTVGTGTIFIDVIDPNGSIANTVILTDSHVSIDWAGKIPNALGVMPKPADDTIIINGYINLVGLDLSSLAGQQVTIALNAYNPIFQGVLDANGNAVQGDASTGKTGAFSVSMPSGKFTCSVKGDYAVSLGLTSQNQSSLLSAHYRIQIGNVFNSPGTSITYGYNSTANKAAKAAYTFGHFFNTGSFFGGSIPGAPNGTGQPGSSEVLLSGGFIVTSADFKLAGDTVSATISGLLSRAGGDGLRPSATSDVVLKIGNFSETLNFSLSPTFRTTGRAPAQRFMFKNKGGSTHIQTLSWANRAGTFQVSTVNLPNTVVGIDPQKGKQPIQLIFTVSPENTQQFIGRTSFDIIKVSDTEFKH